MTVLRVVDIETTGTAPPAEIIEAAAIDLMGNGAKDSWTLSPTTRSSLFKPLHGIPSETMAVHHITEAEVSHAPNFTPELLRATLIDGLRPDALVAHNCAFERSFIPGAVTDDIPWICTLKCALRLWPDAPRHTNQVLRYWRRHAHDPRYAMPPHRAAPDAFVTAHLLWDMLAEASVEQLILWSAEPKLLAKVPFGKHKGALWADVPDDYLAWVTRQHDMDADVVWNANRELGRRG